MGADVVIHSFRVVNIEIPVWVETLQVRHPVFYNGNVAESKNIALRPDNMNLLGNRGQRVEVIKIRRTQAHTLKLRPLIQDELVEAQQAVLYGNLNDLTPLKMSLWSDPSSCALSFFVAL